ncbi:MAG: lycopene cyclase domain-containing protein [Candidatus Paceibacterota bacterium]|jgi:hypothetical protein
MQYLVEIFILFLAWLAFFISRKDLRKDMLWSGYYYFIILSIGFILIKIVSPNISANKTIIPGYWNPDTFFDLGRITGGYSIEDAFYMFLTGGIAAAVYEVIFRKKNTGKKLKNKPHYALISGVLVGGITSSIFDLNLIWVLIIFGFVASLVICLQRRDLIAEVILGGISYLFVYIFFSLLFTSIFPNYITDFYSLQNLSGVLTFNHIPIEELLFALSFGMSWSPIYEYVKNEK